MSSTEEGLAAETRALSIVLELIESEPVLMATGGSFSFSSSAGAIYAGASDDIITENTTVAPTTDYAREKLRQESLVSEFADRNSRVTVLLARISTLYGPGQAKGKRQGLLAHIARCLLRNQPVHIYVPFDTIRDYIAADDAAFAIGAAIYALSSKPGVFAPNSKQVIDNNLYFNGGRPVPSDPEHVLEPDRDPRGRLGDPKLGNPADGLILPRWDPKRGQFLSGQHTIRGEFERLVNAYAALGANSKAVDATDPTRMPTHDILRRRRDAKPDIGCFERGSK